MDAKRALLIAAGLAIGLPYLTVLLLEGGQYGAAAVGALFVGVYLLVVVSDLRGEDADGDESGVDRNTEG